MKLENIKIVMVGTTHGGNIGAAARAMNNMCISRLALVEPQCPVGQIAYGRASGADHILDNRESPASLAEAVADCELVIAASARRRSLAWPELQPVEMVQKLNQMTPDGQAAIVFGREHSGLTNDEVQLCNYMVCIPTNPDFSSLNVASAVQVICYEIFRQHAEVPPPRPLEELDHPASSGEVEGYFQHLEQVMVSSGFLNPESPGYIVQRLRRLYLRAGLSKNEINILRGTLSAIEKFKS